MTAQMSEAERATLLAMTDEMFAKQLREVARKAEAGKDHSLTLAERTRLVERAKELAVDQAADGKYWTLLDFATFQRDTEHVGHPVPESRDKELEQMLAKLGFTQIKHAQPGCFPLHLVYKVCGKCGEYQSKNEPWWLWLVDHLYPLLKRPECWYSHHGYYFTHQ